MAKVISKRALNNKKAPVVKKAHQSQKPIQANSKVVLTDCMKNKNESMCNNAI